MLSYHITQILDYDKFSFQWFQILIFPLLTISGRKYDEKGRLIQWWDSSVIKNFKKIADCIRAQYSSYKIYGRHVSLGSTPYFEYKCPI